MRRPFPIANHAFREGLGTLALTCAVVVHTGCTSGRPTPPAQDKEPLRTLTVCELFKDLPAYQDRMVSVRGIYYRDLGQEGCPNQFVAGGRRWPSALDLRSSELRLTGDRSVEIATDQESWNQLDRAVIRVGQEGHRAEVWATVTGLLRGPYRTGRPGKVTIGGFGHLGVYPAELVVKRVSDIEVKPTPTYDYRAILPRKYLTGPQAAPSPKP